MREFPFLPKEVLELEKKVKTTRDIVISSKGLTIHKSEVTLISGNIYPKLAVKVNDKIYPLDPESSTIVGLKEVWCQTSLEEPGHRFIATRPFSFNKAYHYPYKIGTFISVKIQNNIAYKI